MSTRRARRLQVGAALVAAVVALLLLHGFLGYSPPSAMAEGAQDGTATVGVVPSTASVNQGERVTVSLWLTDAADYYGLDLRLRFDPEIVSATEIVPRWDLFDEDHHILAKQERDNDAGTIWYAISNQNPAEPFTGTGEICALVFQGRKAGTTPLEISYAQGATRDGEALYPTTQDGEIRVGAADLTPVSDGASTPYAIQVYTLTLTNRSATADTFWLTHASTSTSALPPPDNLWEVLTPPSITLGAGLARTFHVTVAVPYEEVDWVTHTATITATSESYGTMANATLTTRTGGTWVADRPGPDGPGYVGCRHDINYSGDIDFYQDVQTVAGKYPSTMEPWYDYNHSGDIDFSQDVQRVAGKYPQECPSP